MHLLSLEMANQEEKEFFSKKPQKYSDSGNS